MPGFLAYIIPVDGAPPSGGGSPPGIWPGPGQPPGIWPSPPGYPGSPGGPGVWPGPGQPPGIWPSPGPLPHPEHPIAPGGPPPGTWPPPGGMPAPEHPIVIPPDAVAPGVPTHPIYLPVYPAHPIVIPPEGTPPEEKPPAVVPPGLEMKVGWTESTGWVVVFVPTGTHPAPSRK